MKEERARHIGIVAVSTEGAALCYRTICMEGATVLGPHDHPQVTMHTYSLAEYMRLVETEGWHEAGLLMLESAALLERAGAELLVCPDNTIHQALDLVRERLTLPWIHIAEEVAAVAASRAFKRLGLLGTRYLMEGPVYPQKLLSRQIAYEIPEGRDRERINRVIFDELVYGRFEAGSRDYLRGVITRAWRTRLRCGGARLHGDPTAHLGRRFAAASPRFDTDPRARGASGSHPGISRSTIVAAARVVGYMPRTAR